MTHHDRGNYKGKHPEATDIDKDLATALKLKENEGKITCAALHKIADTFKMSPSEAGIAADLMEFRISKCQLGLFGYGPEKNILHTTTEPGSDLVEQIMQKTDNSRISCSSCWQIAEESKIGKIEVSRACESLKIKIFGCQIGSFR